MSKSDLSVFLVFWVLAALSGLNHYEIIPLSSLTTSAVNATFITLVWTRYDHSFYSTLQIQFQKHKQKLYIDSTVQVKVKQAKTSDLSWTRRFGDIAPFMQLDIRLILRNKRTKSSLLFRICGVVLWSSLLSSRDV